MAVFSREVINLPGNPLVRAQGKYLQIKGEET